MDRTIQDLKPNRIENSNDRAVDNFAQAMKAKMDAARKKGRTGWNDPKRCRADVLAEMLIGHIGKGNAGNFEDIANFCMMLHQRGDEPSVLAAALVEHDEKVHVRAWDNGYLNGREDTLSEVAQSHKTNSIAVHEAALLRRNSELITANFESDHMLSAEHVNDLFCARADAIERGDV